jgi:hypothetical protein
MQNDAIPIEALFGEGLSPNLDANPRRALHEADVILGVDVMSQREFLLFGRDAIDRIIATGKAEMCRVLRIELDQETTELEKAVALVRTVKGRDDYAG